MQTYLFDIIEGRRRGRSVLHALSYLYRSGVFLRNKAYDSGIFKAYGAGLPVISVGNIVAGGTGKTPFVKFLAQELVKTMKVAILSRGYRSAAEKTGEIVQVTPETDVALCGDEPLWLAKQLPEAQVWVGKNRLESARRAREQGAEIILLDDGMQHRRLKRDFEIVMVDGEDPFGKGFFLPRGLLRDSPRRLKNADLIVANGAQIPCSTPLVVVRMKTSLSLKGKKVVAFCAIGKPERFLTTLREAGAEIAATFFKPDHDPFYPEEIEAFASKSAADAVVCTEKDRVKLPAHFQCSLPLIALPSQLEIISGQDAWEQLLLNIKSRVKHDTRLSSHTS